MENLGSHSRAASAAIRAARRIHEIAEEVTSDVVEKLYYRTLADMPGAPEKAIRDAGVLADTSV